MVDEMGVWGSANVIDDPCGDAAGDGHSDDGFSGEIPGANSYRKEISGGEDEFVAGYMVQVRHQKQQTDAKRGGFPLFGKNCAHRIEDLRTRTLSGAGVLGISDGIRGR